VVKVSHVKDVAATKLSEYKAAASTAIQKYKSLVLEKQSTILQIIRRQRALAMEKLGQVVSWASAKLQVVTTKLRLMELRDMVYTKTSAGKKYVIEMKDTAAHKGDEGRKKAVAFLKMVPGKAYSLVTSVIGKAQVDRVLEVASKRLPVKITNAWVEKKEQ